MLMNRFFLSVLAACMLFSSCSTEPKPRKLAESLTLEPGDVDLLTTVDFNNLTGRWKFEKFDWPNYLTDTDRVVVNSTIQFKDAVYTFSGKDHFSTYLPNIPKPNRTELKYHVKEGNIYIENPDGPPEEVQKIEVDQLTKKYLRIYIPGYPPVATFKKMQ